MLKSTVAAINGEEKIGQVSLTKHGGGGFGLHEYGGNSDHRHITLNFNIRVITPYLC